MTPSRNCRHRSAPGAVRSAVRTVAIALGIALAGVGCSVTTDPAPFAVLSTAPRELRFSLGGFGTVTSQMEVRRDTVLVVRRPFDWRPGLPLDTVRRAPTAGEWAAFWTAVDRAGVHRWQSRYEAKGVIDGAGWGLHLATTERTIDSQGSNAYPDRFGAKHELSMTDDFRAFVAALSDLSGTKVGF